MFMFLVILICICIYFKINFMIAFIFPLSTILVAIFIFGFLLIISNYACDCSRPLTLFPANYGGVTYLNWDVFLFHYCHQCWLFTYVHFFQRLDSILAALLWDEAAVVTMRQDARIRLLPWYCHWHDELIIKVTVMTSVETRSGDIITIGLTEQIEVLKFVSIEPARVILQPSDKRIILGSRFV